MTKMDPEIKARWVAALRSGEYRQTQNRLKNAGGFCCLGVLCDLYAKDAGLKAWNATALGGGCFNKAYHHYEQTPGAVVTMWSGLDATQKVRVKGREDTLYDHNDNGRTFAEIADAIEKQL